MRRRWPGQSWEVVQRLDSLAGIEEWLKDRNDDCDLLSNVRAITAAYKTGHLDWVQGLVTYWYDGKPLTYPRPYSPKELLEIANALGGAETGLWVEGVSNFQNSILKGRF